MIAQRSQVALGGWGRGSDGSYRLSKVWERIGYHPPNLANIVANADNVIHESLAQTGFLMSTKRTENPRVTSSSLVPGILVQEIKPSHSAGFKSQSTLLDPDTWHHISTYHPKNLANIVANA